VNTIQGAQQHLYSQSINQGQQHNITNNEETIDDNNFNNIVDAILNNEEEDLGDEVEEIWHHNNEENTNNDNNNNNEINYRNLTIHDYQPHLYNCVANEIKGDSLQPKDIDHLRIVSANLHGAHAPHLHKWIATTNKIKEMRADMTAFCETCINWQKKSLKRKYQSCLHNQSPNFGKLVNPNMVTSNIDIPFKEDRVPGGTCLITAGKWTSRIESPIEDIFRMGRWCGNVYRLSGN
jgi:hypothetical protein